MGAYMDQARIRAKNKPELRDRYSDLVFERQLEYGHGSYTGTFAEKHEVRVIPGKWERDEAYSHAAEHNNKWGPSYAYDLGDGTWIVAGRCSS